MIEWQIVETRFRALLHDSPATNLTTNASYSYQCRLTRKL